MGKLEEVLELAVIVILITQMIVPWADGKPMWPLLRARNTRKLLSDIEREKQVGTEVALERELEALRKSRIPAANPAPVAPVTLAPEHIDPTANAPQQN